MGGGILFDYELFKPQFAYYQKSGFSVSLKALMNAEFFNRRLSKYKRSVIGFLRKAPGKLDEPFYFVGRNKCKLLLQ